MEEEQSSGPEKQEAADEQQGASATQQAVAAATTTTTTATTVVIRSYECNFCKRGFTNAQALGGHMNIHRKDKAKLKQSSMSTVASSDIPLTPQSQHLPPSPNFFPPPNMFQNHPINHPSGQGKWTFSSSKDHKTTTADITTNKSITHEVKKQLSLLADHHQHQNPSPPPLPSPPAAEGPPELDLELRLGHNSDQPSSDQKGTRKFF